jgi:hypothetical protein
MSIDSTDLKPYKSLIIAELRENADKETAINELLNRIAKQFEIKKSGQRKLLKRKDAGEESGLETAFIHYRESRKARWTSEENVKDTINHLILICRLENRVAICVSDSGVRAGIIQVLRSSKAEERGFGLIEPIPSGILNAAFIKEGRTRTLWLSGTHRKTPIKADSKILVGLNLEDALDPLEDQTYYFSAARSILDNFVMPIGTSPRKSAIWAGTTKDWSDFCKAIKLFLEHIGSIKKPELSPLPVLATSTLKVKEIKDAFDVSLQPPELLSEDPALSSEYKENMEKWAYESFFNVTDTENQNFRAEVFLRDELLGTIDVTLDLSNPQRIDVHLEGEPASDHVRETHKELLHHCRNRQWLKIRYDSGHTFSDGTIFEVQYRDMHFDDFVWVDFKGFNIAQEKPEPLKEVGKHKSLFDWTYKYWPNTDGTQDLAGRWITSDDGSGEIADFIHLDDAAVPPVLTLIHVKAAGSKSRDRKISVSKYEVVTGQAVKNLRFIDRMNMHEGLKKGLHKKISKLVWYNREKATREKMLEALGAIGTRFKTKVVVLQPHLKKEKYENGYNSESSDGIRLKQLETLLLGARANCHALGADFTVICDA